MAEYTIVNGVLRQYRGDDVVLQIPKGVKEIGYRAFYDAKNVKRIVLPQGLKKIGLQAFANCTSLEEIDFPDSLENVSRAGFENTPWLVNSAEPAVYAGGLLLFVQGQPEEVVVREGTKIICADAFRYCTKLKKVVLSKGVEQIGHRAFQDCRNLKYLELPSSLKVLGDRVFEDCRAMEIVLQGREVSIGRKCFPDDTKIHLTDMPPQALPMNVQMGAMQAFAEDMEKQKVFSAEFLETMKRCFRARRKQLYPPAMKDKNLLRLLLDWEIVSVEETELLLDGMVTAGDGEMVASVLRYKEAHTSAALSFDLFDELSLDWEIAEQGKSEDVLKKEWGIKKNIDGSITLLRYHGADVHLVVPATIGEWQVGDIFIGACSPKRYGLGRKSVERLNRIRKVTIEDGVTKIGRYAFAYCENLEEVVLPESVLEIDAYAFYGCNKLKRLTGVHSVEKIGEQAFAQCGALPNDENRSNITE